jgi:hypothetical protein
MPPEGFSSGRGFGDTEVLCDPHWGDLRRNIMRRAIAATFTQHPDLARGLLATGTAALVEDSRWHPFWGIGPDGQGLNWIGRILMEVREKLRATWAGSVGDVGKNRFAGLGSMIDPLKSHRYMRMCDRPSSCR